MSWCFCGAQAGYLHEVDCPRPQFGGSWEEYAKWEEERQSLRRQFGLCVECGKPLQDEPGIVHDLCAESVELQEAEQEAAWQKQSGWTL